MAQFPSRESDVAALAGTMINGLTEHAEHFPASPVSIETLQEALYAYNRTRDGASSAQGAAAEAFAEKEQAFETLKDNMKSILRYAEIALRDDDTKLKHIGWNSRKAPSNLQPPGAPRTLEVKREGRGWVYLDWKAPADGGAVSAYRVVTRAAGETVWKEAVLCFESMTVLTEQPHGIELEYQVIAINRAGASLPSNITTAIL